MRYAEVKRNFLELTSLFYVNLGNKFLFQPKFTQNRVLTA